MVTLYPDECRKGREEDGQLEVPVVPCAVGGQEGGVGHKHAGRGEEEGEGEQRHSLWARTRAAPQEEKKMLYLYGPGHFTMDLGSQMTLQMTSGLWRVFAGA